MANHISFRIFLGCLGSCALLVVGAIWIGEHILPPIYFQTVATLFVIGLASFLIWFSTTLLTIRDSLKK